MTAHPLTIECDDCGFVAISCTEDTVGTFRAHLAFALNWSVRDGDGDLDICGRCCHRRWPRPELPATTTAGTVDANPILVLSIPRHEVLR